MELLLLLAIVVMSTVIFWLTDLDLVVSNWFFMKNSQHWPFAKHEPWYTLNRDGDTYLAVLIDTVSLVILIGSFFVHRWKLLRRYAVFILASVIIGPGLLVNGVFKENWGRPRPNQVVEFGGEHQYVPPLHMGSVQEGNASFPSGHAAIGFSYIAFWFVWRRRRPGLAMLSLSGAMILGGGMSFARVACGAHFLSDILWSAYICYLTSFLLYYFVFRIPQYEAKFWDEVKVEEGVEEV